MSSVRVVTASRVSHSVIQQQSCPMIFQAPSKLGLVELRTNLYSFMTEDPRVEKRPAPRTDCSPIGAGF